MIENKKTEDFYIRFKEQLDQGHTFPGNYIFKFILPTDNKNIALLHKIFDHGSAAFVTRESRNAKYTSLTITMYVVDSESIIGYYKEAGQIKDIVML